jgi:transcriptional regulator with XRE-family HTH domain
MCSEFSASIPPPRYQLLPQLTSVRSPDQGRVNRRSILRHNARADVLRLSLANNLFGNHTQVVRAPSANSDLAPVGKLSPKPGLTRGRDREDAVGPPVPIGDGARRKAGDDSGDRTRFDAAELTCRLRLCEPEVGVGADVAHTATPLRVCGTLKTMEAFYREFGDRLRSARSANGASQIEVAKGVGLSRTSVANIERGRQRITLHLLMEFARVLEVEPCDLLPPAQSEPDVKPDRRLRELSPEDQEPFLQIMRRARKEKVDAEAGTRT